MYGQTAGQAANPIKPMNEAVRPTVGNTHLESIKHLQEAIESLDTLLAKVRGSQPTDTQKAPEEMPSVMGHAGKINAMSYTILAQLQELHAVIGD